MNKGKIVGKFPRVIRSDIRQRTLRELERLVEENANEFRTAWQKHLGQ